MSETYARIQAELIDAMMCLMLNRLQPLGRKEVIHPLDLERYVAACNGLSPSQFYALEPMQEVREAPHSLRWRSPIKTSFPENATAQARLFSLGSRRMVCTNRDFFACLDVGKRLRVSTNRPPI